VLTRTNLHDAEVAAKTHSMRRGCTTGVYPLMLEPIFVSTATDAKDFKPPKPREFDTGYGWS